MSIAYIPCPTRTFEFDITYNGTTPPSNGFYARWRIFDDANNPGAWSDYVRTGGTRIIIPGVPRCNTVQIEVKASCGENRFGAFDTRIIAPNIDYTATIEQQGTCDNNGGGVYKVVGPPGISAVIGLSFQGYISWDGTNAPSGSCAWIETSIGSLQAISTAPLPKKSVNITTPQTVIMPPSENQITVQFPADGIVIVNTGVKMYNVASADTSTAQLRVLSINAVTTQIAATICKSRLSSPNCG